MDREFRIQEINSGAMRMENRPASAILGRVLWDAWPKSENLPVGEAYRRAMQDQVAVSVEQEYERPDGRVVWLDIRAYPTGDGLAVFYRDINERKMAEKAIQESNERFRKIVSQAATGVVQADAQGRMVLVNRKFCDMMGYTEEELMSLHIAQITAPESAQQTREVIAALPHTEKDIVLQKQYLRKDGATMWATSSVSALREAGGAFQGFVAIVIDTTIQKQAEAALRESEAKFRTIAEAMPQVVWSCRADGHHDYFNQRWYDCTGVSPGDTDGNEWQHLFHPEDREALWTDWQRSVTTGVPYEHQYRLRHQSGEYRWTLSRALPLRDEGGAVVRWMGTCTDIHDHKLAEEELKLSNRRKDEFLAMLAHELRNPLAPISAAAQLLINENVEMRHIQHAGDVIARQAEHMTGLIDDLLDVSRVTRGLVSLERDAVDLRVVAMNAVEQVMPLIGARRHALFRPEFVEPVWVQGDRKRLTQILANLLVNAAKYTPDRGTIRLSIEGHCMDAVIHVADTGNGIAPELLPRIFDLFTQAEQPPDRAKGGLGLGLALVKSLVTLHGGMVSVSSEGSGKGSVFTVTLPRIGAPAAQTALSPGPPEPRSQSRRKLLIVDDNADAAQSLAVLLELEGHAVMSETEPHRAIGIAAEYRPDVFVLDIGLPGMDGYALARQLRELPGGRSATFIALTGYSQARDRELSKAAGFDYHFVKPLDMRLLLDALQSAGPEADAASG